MKIVFLRVVEVMVETGGSDGGTKATHDGRNGGDSDGNGANNGDGDREMMSK